MDTPLLSSKTFSRYTIEAMRGLREKDLTKTEELNWQVTSITWSNTKRSRLVKCQRLSHVRKIDR